jgi:ABC-type nitrate/sulfonate/bicarbonate transport system ATPase subunit
MTELDARHVDPSASRGRPDGGPWLRLAGVRQVYGPTLVLDGVDLSMRKDERLAIVGESGGGKSTVLSLVAGLQEPTEGSIRLGLATTARDRLGCCVLMPQKDLLLPWRTALDNACLALENKGVSRTEARRRAAPLFERFGLDEFQRHRPAQLSGGMRQRVAFLRTLLAGKEVLLLDEPFGALDSLTRGQMQSWLAAALEQEPRTVLLVTHDVDEALLLADRVLVLSSRPGRIVAEVAGFGHRTDLRRTIADPQFVPRREATLRALGR